jgi:hypothetical protein
MQSGKILRGLACLLTVIMFWCALPLGAAAADPTPKPDLRYVITRLGDQPPVLPTIGPGTATAQVQSFKFSAQGVISIAGPDGGDLRLAMTGEFAMPDRLHLTVTFTDPQAGEIIPIELIVIGTTPYLHLTKDLAPNGKDTWVLVDNPGGMNSLPGVNLPNVANLPPVSTQMQTIGDETVGGVPTTHTRTTIDATALLGGSAKGAKPSMLTLDLWTGKSDTFPRRLTINGALSIDPNALLGLTDGTPSSAADIVNATLTFSMNFTDLNTPVTIAAPTAFVKLSDILGAP